ncbi:glycosyltransferase family 2 protein [Brevibacillus humidisoli]|uniref:glycosyltransferase family 2 protein n=1 Tax=Brevibacillus humidisoli TaxID=2895522 RepID=UPI001E480238|nr:glycosyltransferase family 2 protein [Brevibacillus humidisoli]UFJ42538.1 glycosyltransferase family 2 protein [Brevibacillus humidisoli]
MITVSIILPTYNGIEYIEEVLQAVFGQRTRFRFEMIVIDSGSTDGTLDVIKQYPVRLYQIEKSEFGHGKTRNYGAELAQGNFLVFITQDATPADDDWLEELIMGFVLDPLVGCVFGKQIPRPGCDPITKRDLLLHFEAFSKTDAPLLQQMENTPEGWKLFAQRPYWYGFNSNVNSALKKDVWQKIRFRDVLYTEDQLIGREIITSGYKKVYAPKAAVFHSHSYPTFFQYFQRFFDELRGMEMAFGYKEDVRLLRLIPDTFSITLKDARYIFEETELPFADKIYWVYFRWWINFYRRLGAYFGCRHKRLPPMIRKAFSREKNPG